MGPDELKIGMIQTTLYWEDVPANLASFEEKIALLEDRPDVIILPEMFATGFSMNPQQFAEPLGLTITRWMQQVSSQTGALLLGSFAAKEHPLFYNRLVAMRPDGTYDTYDKRHLFRMGHEDKTYHPGSSRLLVEWKGWRICPLICYDLRFPVWSRNTPGALYDLLVYVANWPGARAFAWDTLLRARAIENQSYVAGVNRIGADGLGVGHSGGSVALNYLGETITNLGHADTQRTVRLSKSGLTAFRDKFPAYLDGDRFEISNS